jgi:hypothetical protein
MRCLRDESGAFASAREKAIVAANLLDTRLAIRPLRSTECVLNNARACDECEYIQNRTAPQGLNR